MTGSVRVAIVLVAWLGLWLLFVAAAWVGSGSGLN